MKTKPMMDVLESRVLLTTVSGLAYADANGNGHADAGEGLAGCVVTFNEDTTHHVGTPVTAADGSYAVTLEPGTYHVTVDGPGVTTPFDSHSPGASDLVVSGDAMTVQFKLNGGSGPVTPPAKKADLAVAVTSLPNTLFVGAPKSAPVTVTVTNKGGAYSGPVTATVYFSKNKTIESTDYHLAPITLPVVKLGAGANKVFKFDAAALLAQVTVPGTYNVLVGLSGLVNDANAANNTAAGKTATKMLPAKTTNLVPGALTMGMTGAQTGKFSMTLRNTGTAAAVGKVTIALFARPDGGGADIALPAVSGVAVNVPAGKSVTLANKPVDLRKLGSGLYRLVATVTSVLSIAESKTSDNTVVGGEFALELSGS